MPLEFPWTMLALTLLLPAIGIWLWLIARRRHLARPPPMAIVLLLRSPRPINAQLLAGLLSKETGRTIAATTIDAATIPDDTKPANDTVIGMSPHFVVVVDGTFFMVHNLPKPYGGAVVTEHAAWLSMDILHPEAVSIENYRIVGRVLSHLVGDDCVALYHPPLKSSVPYTEETAARLREDDPVKAVFGETRPEP